MDWVFKYSSLRFICKGLISEQIHYLNAVCLKKKKLDEEELLWLVMSYLEV